MPLGLSIIFENKKEEWWKELLISIAGPGANLIIAICLIFFYNGTYNQFLIYSNVLICIFNLIPIIPLDGGRILKSILLKVCRVDLCETYIYTITNVVMIVLTIILCIGTIYLKNISIPFIIVYLWIIVIGENKRHKLKMKIKRILEQNKNIDY